jgi:hypothetical protein
VALDREDDAVTRWRRLLLLTPAFVLLLSSLLPVSFSTPIPLCAVKALTGADCPGCGMTRAFLLIGHGRAAEATAVHPLGVPAFLIVAGLAVVGLCRAVAGAPRSTSSRPGTARRSTWSRRDSIHPD